MRILCNEISYEQNGISDREFNKSVAKFHGDSSSEKERKRREIEREENTKI